MRGVTINETGPLYPDATHDVAMVLAFLGALPYDTDEMAAHLFDRGFTGRPGDCSACPVASYLDRDIYSDIEVTSERITLHVREWEFSIVTPEPVRAFIASFDAGLFPFLYSTPGGK